jgi:hypothetical protein
MEEGKGGEERKGREGMKERKGGMNELRRE